MIIRVGAKGGQGAIVAVHSADGRSAAERPPRRLGPPNIFRFDGDGRLVEEWVRRLQVLSPSTWSTGDPVQAESDRGLAVLRLAPPDLARFTCPARHGPRCREMILQT